MATVFTINWVINSGIQFRPILFNDKYKLVFTIPKTSTVSCSFVIISNFKVAATMPSSYCIKLFSILEMVVSFLVIIYGFWALQFDSWSKAFGHGIWCGIIMLAYGGFGFYVGCHNSKPLLLTLAGVSVAIGVILGGALAFLSLWNESVVCSNYPAHTIQV